MEPMTMTDLEKNFREKKTTKNNIIVCCLKTMFEVHMAWTCASKPI